MVASYGLMLELFVDCNTVREYCNRLQVEAEILQEVSMNAAIAAGHTGSHIRTFTEVARQIGTSSSRLASRVSKMRADTSRIVNEALDAMLRATQLSHFERCVSRVKNEANQALIRDRMEKFEIRIDDSIEKIYRDTLTIISDLKSVEDIQKRLWAVITRLRIEASSMEPEQQDFVSSIADSFGASIDRSGVAFGLLFETVRKFEAKLPNPRASKKEISNVS